MRPTIFSHNDGCDHYVSREEKLSKFREFSSNNCKEHLTKFIPAVWRISRGLISKCNNLRHISFILKKRKKKYNLRFKS